MYILDLPCGYVTCDVCGSGQNYIQVTKERTEDGVTLYVGHIRSNCYRNHTTDLLDRAGLVKFLDEWDFLISTRPARRGMKEFRRQLEAGVFDAPAREAVDPLDVSWDELNRLSEARRIPEFVLEVEPEPGGSYGMAQALERPDAPQYEDYGRDEF